MITVSAFYQNDEGKRFDMVYYFNKHIPMIKQKLGPACKRISVEQGLGGATPGTRARFLIMFHLHFDSVEAFQTAFGPHAQEIMGDIPNYTDIQPMLQVSEVKM